MGKTKKLQVSKAQPAIPKNATPKKGFKKPKKTHLIQKPVPQPLLVAIHKIPYSILPGPDKIKTLKIAYVQLHLMNLSLLGLHQFLCGKGLGNPTDKDIDCQVLLQVIKQKNKADPTGFLPIAMSEGDVNRAIAVRNNTAHLNFNQIDQTWMNDVPALILLNCSVNQPGAAAEIQGIVRQMMSGSFDGLVRFSFAFTPGFTFQKAFGLSMIVYGVFLKFLAEALLALLQLKLGVSNITMDIYANMKYIKDQVKKNPDYLSPGGVSRNDAQVLQTVFDARNDIAHGAYTRSSRDWKGQLGAVVDILGVLNNHNEALEVQTILDRLIKLEADGATVTQEDFGFIE